MQSNESENQWKSLFEREKNSTKKLKEELYSKAVERNEIVMAMKNCLLEAKKIIYMRKHAGEAENVDLFDIDQKIPFAEFESEDRVSAVRMLMDHELVMEKMMEFVEAQRKCQIETIPARQMLGRPETAKRSTTSNLFSQSSTKVAKSRPGSFGRFQVKSANKHLFFNMKM